jgi:hypothetical protein
VRGEKGKAEEMEESGRRRRVDLSRKMRVYRDGNGSQVKVVRKQRSPSERTASQCGGLLRSTLVKGVRTERVESD